MRATLLVAGLMWPATVMAQTTGGPLVLEAKIPLPLVSVLRSPHSGMIVPGLPLGRQMFW